MVFAPRRRQPEENRHQWKKSKRSHHRKPMHQAHWLGRTEGMKTTTNKKHPRYGT